MQSGYTRSLGVVLPGSGSDDVFVRSAFGPAFEAAGITLHAPAPRPGPGVVAAQRAALDAAAALAARTGSELLVGGVSLGAQVALRWAAGRSPRPGGVLVVMPAWGGDPGDAPAALAARLTAARVREGGVDAAVAEARAGAPEWLAAELDRAWRGHGDGLAASLDAAAGEPGPTAADLRRVGVPVGIVGMDDDPVHPVALAHRWAGLLPRAALRTSTLAGLGADRTVLGRLAVEAWRAAGARHVSGA